MYGEARQKEGGSTTSLGSWRGFEDGHSTLLFDGGQQCWNGPQRSMRARQLSLHTACESRVSWWDMLNIHSAQRPKLLYESLVARCRCNAAWRKRWPT